MAVILASADTERGGLLHSLRPEQKRHITVVKGGRYNDNIEVLMYSFACIMLS